MKKIVILLLIFTILFCPLKINTKAAEIPGYPPNLATWSSQQLYADYYHMRIHSVDIDKERKVLSIFVPDFDNIISSAGQNTEQKIIFYDRYEEELSSESVFGRLIGWFNYSIPEDAYYFSYFVLVEGPLASNYVAEWNDVAYVGYGDLLEIYQEAWWNGYDKGYDEGSDYGYGLGVSESYDVGKADGKIEGYNNGREDFGIFYNGQWRDATYYGDIRFTEGTQVGDQEAFDEGYLRGSEDIFLSNFDKWIVPAIFIVIVVGGFFTLRGRREN